MAMRLKMIKMISEYAGYAQVTNRRPTPKRPLLYLIQLRAHNAHSTTEKRRLTVESAGQAAINAPLPVKINIVQAGNHAFPVVIR